MKPSAPKTIIWLIAIIVGIVGIIGYFVDISFISEYSYWLVVAGFGLLAIGTTFKGV